MSWIVHCGDSLHVLRGMADASVDAIVTDPPYGLSFMGKRWDYDVPSVEIWAECLRVLKPGGHLLAFAGTRTQHRMAVRIEDAGFEIRDMIAWVYGSGFPKSLDVSKAIDKAAGAERTEVIGKSARHGGGIVGNGSSYEISPEVPMLYAPATDAARQWQGWGTALKPALEPITVARKPLAGTVAQNVLAHGTGALNISATRIELGDEPQRGKILTTTREAKSTVTLPATSMPFYNEAGRWPANLIHDGSEEVVRLFPQAGDDSAARFFYTAKADSAEREVGCDKLPKASAADLVDREAGSAGMNNPRAGAGRTSAGRANTHPTVKPVDLMRYLVRLVTPRGGLVLDPFAGSGTTGIAALLEKCSFTGIELDPRHVEIANARIAAAECRDIYAGSDGSTKLREKGDERQASLFDFSSPTVGEPAGTPIAVATAATGSAYDGDDLPW